MCGMTSADNPAQRPVWTLCGIHHAALYWLWAALGIVTVQSSSPLVSLQSGQILSGASSGNMTSFLGVPYAAPPVGRLRFQAPQPLPAWEGVRRFLDHGAECLQPVEALAAYYDPIVYDKFLQNNFSEDCLTLDIYIPGSVAEARARPRAVMTWIHGGAYITGSKSFLGFSDGGALAMAGDLVVVSVNYRLASFGFLSLDLPGFASNVGLLDQRFALRWLRDNIAAFGGDPRRLTLFGQSAGGGSIAAHILSPRSSGLFQRAIVQSGQLSSVMPTAAESYQTTTVPLAAALGCPTDSRDQVASCLLAAEAGDLAAASLKQPYIPYIDGDFLPQQPGVALMEGTFNKVPLLIGYNSDDGDVLVSADGPAVYQVGVYSDVLPATVAATLYAFHFFHSPIPDALWKAVTDLVNFQYFTSVNEPMANLRGLLDLSRDSFFAAPSIQFADYISASGAEVYMYKFSQRTGMTNHENLDLHMGAGHGEDIGMVFGTLHSGEAFGATPAPLEGVTMDELDVLSNTVMDSWAGFAKGSAISFRVQGGSSVTWPRYSAARRAFVDFTVNMTTNNVRSNLDETANLIWNKILPALITSGSTGPGTGCQSEDLKESDPAKPVVKIDSGYVQGLLHTELVTGLNYETYLGIPYAKAPIGDLRWRKPEAASFWTGVYQATTFGKTCEESEDCLFLNIWVPHGVGFSKMMSQPLYPVLVIFHHGSFVTGSGNMNPQALVTNGEILVVSLNYRLGALGFLSTSDGTARGNYGLWDQSLALSWIQANIRAFRGDPTRVTISGTSAGAISASALMLSPQVRGFFKSVIASSSSVFAPSALLNGTQARKNALELAASLGCLQRSTAVILDCLRRMSAEDVLAASTAFNARPVVDGEFLPAKPELLFDTPTLEDISFLGGSISTEGYEAAVALSSSGTSTLDSTAATVSATFPDSPAVAEAFRLVYFRSDGSGVESRTNFNETWSFMHDFLYGAPTERVALLHAAKGGRAYTYDLHLSPMVPSGAIATHLSDLPFMLGQPLLQTSKDQQEFSPGEVQLAKTIVTYISNFVHSGNPNLPQYLDVEWPQYTVEEKAYLELTNPVTPESRKTGKKRREYAFWNELVPEMMEKTCSTFQWESIESVDEIKDGEEEKGIKYPSESCVQTRSDKFKATASTLETILIVLISLILTVLIMLAGVSVAFLGQKAELKSLLNKKDEENRGNSAIYACVNGIASSESMDTRI